MFIMFFLCWVIFNQAFTIEIAIFGIVISAALYLFCCKFMGFSIKKDLFIAKKIPLILGYIGTILVEVFKANVTIIKFFFREGKVSREPVIVTFKTSLKSKMARMLLANSITLTPGTITVSLKEDTYMIHCFDKSLAKGLNDTVFEKKLKKLEEGFDA